MKTISLFTLVALFAASPRAHAQLPSSNVHPTLAQQGAALRAAATTFCTEVHREHIEGLPTDAQMQRLSPVVTPELHGLFKIARAIQQEQMRQHPDDKPFWIEGDPFSSLTEGVTAWELGEAVEETPVDGTVQVRQTYAEPNQKLMAWTDTLVFKQHDGRWLLDDIRMGGEWMRGSDVSLRANLPGGGKDAEDHVSIDQRWQIKFTRRGEHVIRVTIQPTDKSGEPFVLFGGGDSDVCVMPTWIVWSPHSDMLALRLGNGHRYTRTHIFQLVGQSWKPVPMPELHPEERKTMLSQGLRERYRLIDAEHWQDANTLVVKYFGSFESKETSDGYFQLISVRVDADGQARVIDAVDAPGEP